MDIGCSRATAISLSRHNELKLEIIIHKLPIPFGILSKATHIAQEQEHHSFGASVEAEAEVRCTGALSIDSCKRKKEINCAIQSTLCGPWDDSIAQSVPGTFVLWKLLLPVGSFNFSALFLAGKMKETEREGEREQIPVRTICGNGKSSVDNKVTVSCLHYHRNFSHLQQWRTPPNKFH